MNHTIRLGKFNWLHGLKFNQDSRVPASTCYTIYEHCEETDSDRWLASFLFRDMAETFLTMSAGAMKLPIVNDLGSDE